MRIVDPARGDTLADMRKADAATVADAVRRVRGAQPAWAAEPLETRCAPIRRFRALVLQRTEPLARTLTHEVGKPIVQAKGELAGVRGVAPLSAEVDRILAIGLGSGYPAGSLCSLPEADIQA